MEIEHKVNQLKYENVFPEGGKVEHLETHMSHVFLTEQHVYKLKKPILHDYLDFSTLEKRKKFCETELNLNQRLAEEIYLEVVPLNADHGLANLERKGKTVDWLVKMKRISEENILDNLLKKDRLPLEAIKKPLIRLAEFYNNAPAEISSEEEYLNKLRKGIKDGIDMVTNNEFNIPKDTVQHIDQFLDVTLDEKPQLFMERVKIGKIIEGHGDLRPEHLCIDPPVIFDALEFNREFRIVDPVDELSYLCMEATKDRHPELEKLIFDTYTHITNDKVDDELIRFYKVARTLLRARLAIKRLIDIPSESRKKWTEKAKNYLVIGEKLIS